MDKNFLMYVFNEENPTLLEGVKHEVNYKKIYALLDANRECIEVLSAKQFDIILQYIFSKLNKTYKFKEHNFCVEVFHALLRLFKDIEFKGATGLCNSDIIKEFNQLLKFEIWELLEDCKDNKLIQIETVNNNFVRFI